MRDIRVPLKPSHSGPILGLYEATAPIAYGILNDLRGPTVVELATLKARATDFLALPLIQALDSDGL